MRCCCFNSHYFCLQFQAVRFQIKNSIYGKTGFYIGKMGAFIIPAKPLHTRSVESSNLPSATKKGTSAGWQMFFVCYFDFIQCFSGIFSYFLLNCVRSIYIFFYPFFVFYWIELFYLFSESVSLLSFASALLSFYGGYIRDFYKVLQSVCGLLETITA